MKRFLLRLFLQYSLSCCSLSWGRSLGSQSCARKPARNDGTINVGGFQHGWKSAGSARRSHIRAQSIEDALFAQDMCGSGSFVAMDLSRRKAEGKLSEVFGDRTLRLDIESRTLAFPRWRSSAHRTLSG